MRLYTAEVSPENPDSFDEGLSLTITLLAHDRGHAMRRLSRYVPGVVTSLKVADKESERR